MSETVPVKRPQGRAGHLTDAERAEIRLAYLSELPRPTRTALAARFGVDRGTVALCLQGAEFDRLEREVIAQGKERAKRRLEEAAEAFADDWVSASRVAAEDGNHKPAKEGLQAIGVVEPDASGASVALVFIGDGDGFIDQDGRRYEVPDFPPGTPDEITTEAHIINPVMVPIGQGRTAAARILAERGLSHLLTQSEGSQR